MLAQSDAYPTLQASFVDDIIVKAETIGLVSYFSDLTEVLRNTFYIFYVPLTEFLFMEIRHAYRDNKKLRDSFNELAGKVFGLNFESWYQNGFWNDPYDPYSVIVDGKVVSNVSVNRCDMNYKGRIIHLIQLGTVMTDPEYRGRGYSRILMEKVLEDNEGADGIYLYGNDSVAEFYPRFGFEESKEYCYSKDVTIDSDRSAESVPMSEKRDWDKMAEIIGNTDQNADMYMVNNTGLYMFYLSQFMQENTFYIPALDTYVIAEFEDGTLILHAVTGKGDIDKVIDSFGREIRHVQLAFTPKDTAGFTKSEVTEEDSHFFVKGKFFNETKGSAFMFQPISHA